MVHRAWVATQNSLFQSPPRTLFKRLAPPCRCSLIPFCLLPLPSSQFQSSLVYNTKNLSLPLTSTTSPTYTSDQSLTCIIHTQTSTHYTSDQSLTPVIQSQTSPTDASDQSLTHVIQSSYPHPHAQSTPSATKPNVRNFLLTSTIHSPLTYPFTF